MAFAEFDGAAESIADGEAVEGAADAGGEGGCGAEGGGGGGYGVHCSGGGCLWWLL